MKNPYVLIVEDEAIIALGIEAEITGMGYETRCAFRVSDALRLIESATPLFAILDYQVGDENTAKVASRLTALRVPFIVCSGSEGALLEDVFSAGRFLAKPFKTEELMGLVSTVDLQAVN